jgi:lipoyl(octanoyl) transferase
MRMTRLESPSAIGIRFEQPVPFDQAVRLQEEFVAARQASLIPDVVLFLEHPPVVTLGRRGRVNFLLKPVEELQRLGIHVARASRGGDVTYHAPGQVVMYPILKLGSAEADSHGYLWNLEEIAIRTAAAFGVSAYRRPSMNGAWTDSGKIAAIGFHLKRWVTMHGMSVNVDLDLRGFDYIVGCGLVGERVTSFKAILGERCPSSLEVVGALAASFSEVCGRSLSVGTSNSVAHPVAKTCLQKCGF